MGLTNFEADILVHMIFGNVNKNDKLYDVYVKMAREITEGNHQTMIDLAIFFEHGCDEFEIKQDNKKSIYWYGEAAKNGNAQACYYYGNRLIANSANGEIAELEKQGIQYIRIAADAGIPRAQQMLGIAYTNGWGVDTSYEKALYYLQKALENGEETAKEDLDILKHKFSLIEE